MRERIDQTRLTAFIASLARRMRRPVRLYLVGGSVMIDLGLRSSTLDVDYAADSDDPAALAELEQAIRSLKNELNANVEPASPSDFLPVPPSIRARARFVRQVGVVGVYYFDLPTQVIAKAARGLEQDLADAVQLVRSGHVAWDDVMATWAIIRDQPTGWLRYEPTEIESRLDLLRRRVAITTS